MRRIDRFIDDVAAYSSPRVFNPWSTVDATHDIGDTAPAIRRDNLRRYLAERSGSARLLLIAEAAGYQGCKFSGIAMTSERQLTTPGALDGEYFNGAKRRTSRESVRRKGFTEPTATIVWGRMRAAGMRGRDWVNWNTFAWHPQGGSALSNRTPTPQEVSDGVPVLLRFLSLFPGVPIVAVGRKAEEKLETLGVQVVAAVRHPANGGASAFGEGIQRVLDTLRR